ncbi:MULTISPECIES: beta-propeller domain-containing protein [unclassified Sutcliffiella]|uniref:beta-propeller domain-containing protein n=1 Tax=unclassified Sutcliffiella TaxID=2837532 RepID=UPI0030CD16E1
MKKRVVIFSFLVVGLAIIFAAFYQTKEPFTVNGTGNPILAKDTQTVLSNKTWMLTFTKEFKKESIDQDESIYVTDKDGNRVESRLEISDDHVTVMPPDGGYDPKKGPYVLHISGDIESVDGKKLDEQKNIKFTAIAELPTVASKKELNKLFTAQLEQMETAQRSSKSFFEFSKEESTSTSDDSASGSDNADMGASEAESAGGGHSDTNVQVQGVDEADIVKTDGDFIYQATDQKLKITKAAPVEKMTVVSELRYKDFSPYQLFLDGNQLVVIGTFWDEKMYSSDSSKVAGEMIMPMYDSTKAIIYDISDRSNPVVQKTITLEGNYVSSRKIENHVYLITNKYADYWILREHPEADLRPRISDTNGEEEEKLEAVPYDGIRYFPDSSENNFMTIASLDLNQIQDDAAITTYVGSGNQIYMSKENLYVAVPNYSHGPHWTHNESTEVYKFEVEGTSVEFHANGSIPGYLLNQFSMDEHKGYFRVAATKGQTWDEHSPSSNHLFILDGGMNVVSSVEDLARGERIYSVRFMQDKAYVVTFKEVDPLFVFDLSNPNEPKVLGELKIPGFSNYLHPYDENHLIGFGYDTKLEKDQWGTRVVTNGVKISLFDVSDPTNPLEKHTEIIGGRSTHSPLNYDHKALLFNKEKDIFAFPITSYNENDKDGSYRLAFEGAMVYGIDPDKGFTLHKKITHQQENSLYEDWENMVQRILYIDEHLYTVTPKEVKATKITW